MADRASAAADDHIKRLAKLQEQRSGFERIWKQVANVAVPEAAEFHRMSALGLVGRGGYGSQYASAGEQSKYIFDSTGINAVDRLASGIEALVVPQSEYWHGLDLVDLTRDAYSHEEMLWLERQRNVLFRIRYDSDSGWTTAIQTALRRLVAFGNAFIWLEDDDDYQRRAMILYRYLPLAQCYIATDHLDIAHTFYRHYTLTASQALGKFKEKTPERIRKAAESSSDSEKPFSFIHCVFPRGDWGLPSKGVQNTPWASHHIFEEDRVIIRESGYFEFPVIDFRWLPESPNIYGEGPLMKCIADVQSLQHLARNELLTGEQAVNPTLLMAHAGVMNRPTNQPGSVILGGLNAQGQPLVTPLFQGQRLDFATMVLEAKRAQVKDSMYLNLFQILVKNPQMTATEALIRANEKGELLGPAGSRIQASLSRMIEREIKILKRRGLHDDDSAYAVPSSLRGRKIDVVAQMTSPLDRLRRAKEGEGILRLLELAAPLAQIDPSALDKIDPDRTIAELHSILGAPVSILRSDDAVAEIRQQRAEERATALNATVSEQLAKASKQGTEALVGMKEAGVL